MGERRARVYGPPPHAQLQRLSEGLRELVTRALLLPEADPELERVIEAVERSCRALEPLGLPDPSPRMGAGATREQRIYFDHSRFMGGFVPFFPVYTYERLPDRRARGQVHFDLGHEGPPGLVFGGSLAQFFDLVFQHHGSELGAAGYTASHNVTYHRITPLLVDIDYEVWEARLEGRKRFMAAKLSLDGDTLVECEALQIAPSEEERRLVDRNPRV